MACCRAGARMSFWTCRWSRRCFMIFRVPAPLRSKGELFAQVGAADIGGSDDVAGTALLEDRTLIDDIGAVADLERLADTVVGDENAQPLGLEGAG